jgi:hypothetical protein
MGILSGFLEICQAYRRKPAEERQHFIRAHKRMALLSEADPTPGPVADLNRECAAEAKRILRQVFGAEYDATEAPTPAEIQAMLCRTIAALAGLSQRLSALG